MSKQDHTPPEAFRLRLAKCLLTLIWLAIIAVCLLHKDEFTLEGILSYTPRQPVLAAAMLWALFAVKSLSIFLYSGLLYAASGILFPLPVAIAVNIAGTAVMVSIPYWLGKSWVVRPCSIFCIALRSLPCSMTSGAAVISFLY